jgi:hypothetical protein
LAQHFSIHLGDRSIEAGQIANVERGIADMKIVVVEAAVRELAVKGHLAAFETGADAATGTSGLAFATATGSFAMAAAFAAANALLAMDSTFNVLKFVESHDIFLYSALPCVLTRAELGLF